MTRAIPRTELSLPLVVTHLMKGVVYRDTHDQVWQHLVQLVPQVSDYVATIGLVVVLDESEGYAFLRSKPEDPDDRASGAPPIPRLIARHALSFHTSLMLALLRKKLAESDAADDSFRLILDRDQIVDMMVVFMSTSTNEARIVDIIDRTISKVVELGFLRRMPKQDNQFEVRRVLKAFVDGQWLSDFDTRLAEYAAELGESQ
ncbi:DUF4194 domain-containing protein [Candidatus Mycobacterium methanotrophicum]|uniref:DUF4194 domain-containing protein n=2 Tax=Candidatus Mycobacterium methanotrophicum TaxID=2943498 RepID=A0ABY4QTA3_9MYCO|nr:DUF4194 domain-containing protein [Candidatus Mycobacterium methanotrophicum]UQX12895.1 DUF4194 domain-containing protein [Candidatus Mycobacterium methanotrophicum]